MSITSRLLATVAAVTLYSFAAVAQTPPVDPKAPVMRAEFNALLKDALKENPNFIVDAIKGMQEKQKATAEKEVQQAIEKNRDVLFKDMISPSLGDPKIADVTLVEFFDYHCGYCKRMLPTIAQLNKEDPKVRIIFRELPILSEDSTVAARAATAVYHLKPEKYFAFHSALMEFKGEFNDKSLEDVVKKQGLDWNAVKTEMASPKVQASLDSTRKLADDLGVRGTPAVVIGNQLIPGAVPYEELKKIVENVRASASAKASDVKPEAPAAKKPN
jgi:protein-disulfide isomerase